MADKTQFEQAHREAVQLRQQKHFSQAIAVYERAISLGWDYVRQWEKEARSDLFNSLAYNFAEIFLGTKGSVESQVKDGIPVAIQETYGEWAAYTADRGQFEQALALLKRAGTPLDSNLESKFKDSECEIYHRWGVSLAEQGRFGDAVARLRAALEIKPKDPTLAACLAHTYVQWGKSLTERGNYSTAVENFKEALKLTPGDQGATAYLVDCYVKWSERLVDQGAFMPAIANLNEALEFYPRHPRVTRLLAEAYIRSGDTSGSACKAVENAYAMNPNDRALILGLARIYLIRKPPFDIAEPVLYKAYEIDPRPSDLVIALATGYLSRSQRDVNNPKAFGVYCAAYKIRPLWRSLILALADIYASRPDICHSNNAGDNDKVSAAIGIMEQSLRYSLDNRPVLDALAAHYLQRSQHRFSEVKVLQRVASWKPKDLELILYLANVLKDHFKDQKAILWYRQAIALDHAGRKSVPAWMGLAEIYARNNMQFEAIEACKKALVLEPKYGRLHLMLGEIYRDLGELEKAKAQFEEARQCDPLLRDAYDGLGEIVASFGERKEAIQYYEHLLTKVNPNDTDAAYKAARIYFAASEYARAAEVLRRVNRVKGPDAVPRGLLLGRALLAAGDYQEAVNALNWVLNLSNLTHDERKEALFYLGLAHLKLESFGKSISSYAKLLKAEGDHIPALLNTGVAYARGGDIQKAREFFNKALDIDPYLSAGYTNLAMCLMRESRISDAVELCLSDKFLQSSPVTALSMAATLLCRMGDWERMGECAARLHHLCRDTLDDMKAAESSFLCGTASYLCGQPDQAKELLEECGSKLWDSGDESWKAEVIRTWVNGVGALADYEASPDFESVYETLKASMDADMAIGDFVTLKLCRSLISLSPSIRSELTEIARGTGFGSRLASKREVFVFPLLVEEEFQYEDEAARYQNWLAVGPPMEGGMATVVKVYNSKLKVFGARKQLKPSSVSKSLDRNGFRREAHFCARLRHPNIVYVFPDSIDDRNFSFVMEWMDRGSLASLIKAGRLPVAEAVEIMVEAGKGLAFFHSLSPNNIHRDFTPGNILLDEAGHVKVADFGVARIEEENAQFTMAEDGKAEEARIAGKYPYMAPEQWQGKTLDQRADQYSFGVTLYEALTGELPLKPENQGSQAGWLHVAVEGIPAPPNVLNPDIPEDLSNAVLRMLSKKPSDRFTSMDEVLAVLKKILARLKGGEPSQ